MHTSPRPARVIRILLSLALAVVAGCTVEPTRVEQPSPAQVRARIVTLLPGSVHDAAGWATDIYAAFAALQIDPDTSNLCAALSVTEQESTFHADPVVPGLGRIARAEIERRASAHHVPGFVLSAALAIHSPTGKSYAQRIAAVRTERQLSQVYEDFVGMVPLGRQLFGNDNPVRTGGPMQVSIAFAQAFAQDHPYPYPIDGSIRHEVFSRRGGVYFGIAHLLDYPASYRQPLYRFADYNAGWYASRNAAFQHAVTVASGIPLALDGDLVRHDGLLGSSRPSHTELAVRTLATRLDLGDSAIHRALARGESADFEQTDLYRRVFALADRLQRHRLPRARLPGIELHSPKITRKLTTAWFAKRVDHRYQRCMARAPAPR